MADAYKGLTIEIGGKTDKLVTALKNVNSDNETTTGANIPAILSAYTWIGALLVCAVSIILQICARADSDPVFVTRTHRSPYLQRDKERKRENDTNSKVQ